MDRLKSLMNTLRRLANDKTIDFKGAKLAIWKCIFEELDKAGREPFLRELRKQAADEEMDAPSELVKLFWRDVLRYASAPTKPKL
jgi:hypothetical protein